MLDPSMLARSVKSDAENPEPASLGERRAEQVRHVLHPHTHATAPSVKRAQRSAS
jgi:hypothetical protein